MTPETLRILWIEDDAKWAGAIADWLKSVAFRNDYILEFDLCESWHGALGAAKEYDVVLLDLGLPDSEASETVERLKGVAKEWPAIVVVTGRDAVSYSVRCINAGADNFFTKGQMQGDIPAFFVQLLFAIVRNRTRINEQTA